MSPVTRRRSARLAAGTTAAKSKPVASELASITEKVESPARKTTAQIRHVAVSPVPTPATPASSALKPPNTEMHPSRFHATSQAPSSALRLGFTDINASKRRDSMHGAGIESTPTKIGGVPSSSAFSFRVDYPAVGAHLSSDAQKILQELRGDAARIKADMVAERAAGLSTDAGMGERAFAKPKGKAGRFSAAHMAEFQKMDSIEGHASAWRAQPGRTTPAKSLKRTASKANLDSTPTPRKSNSQLSLAKAAPEASPNDRSTFGLKRKQSTTRADNRPSSTKRAEATSPAKDLDSATETVSSPSKRFKQQAEDDASVARPVSRGTTSIPQPTFSIKKPGFLGKSVFSRLMSPTKSSLAQCKPTTAPFKGLSKETESILDKPERLEAKQTTAAEPSATDEKSRIMSPSRFVKSILRTQKPASDDTKSGIPQPVPSQSQTPALARSIKALPSVPLTTPRRKLVKHVTFTPETVRVTMDQVSPSPFKSGLLGRTKPALDLGGSRRSVKFDSVTTSDHSGDVVYPDLSGLKHLLESEAKETNDVKEPEPSVPGTFTFRSDHTIKFGRTPPSGFGASQGQASIRHVRESIKPATEKMPGGFPQPSSPTSHPNKENSVPTPPKVLTGALHGMSNKKRQRTSSIDSDTAGEGERAAKKRKQEGVGAKVAVTPNRLGVTPVKKRFDRPLGRTPVRTPGRTPAPTTDTPAKKRTTVNMDRLNMLARPKHRA